MKILVLILISPSFVFGQLLCLNSTKYFLDPKVIVNEKIEQLKFNEYEIKPGKNSKDIISEFTIFFDENGYGDSLLVFKKQKLISTTNLKTQSSFEYVFLTDSLRVDDNKKFETYDQLQRLESKNFVSVSFHSSSNKSITKYQYDSLSRIVKIETKYENWNAGVTTVDSESSEFIYIGKNLQLVLEKKYEENTQNIQGYRTISLFGYKNAKLNKIIVMDSQYLTPLYEILIE